MKFSPYFYWLSRDSQLMWEEIKFCELPLNNSYPTLSTPGVGATHQQNFLLYSRGPQGFSTQAQNLWTFSEIIEYKLGQTY